MFFKVGDFVTLRNKGYLLVEIIVAFTIAMIMVYFLLEIVINLKNLNEDYYVDTKLENDKTLMTKHVMDDVNQYELVEVNKSGNTVLLTFKDDDREFTKKLSIDDKMFMYGEFDTATNRYDNDTLFTKTFDTSLNVENPTIEVLCYKNNRYVDCDGTGDEEHKQLNIEFSAKTIYSDYDYGVNLKIDYVRDEIVVNCLPIKFSYFIVGSRSRTGENLVPAGSDNFSIVPNTDNKVLKIKTSGVLTINNELNCEGKNIYAVLVGGGNAGGNGSGSRWGGTTFGFMAGNGARGGNGGTFYKTSTNLDIGTYQITVGAGSGSSRTISAFSSINDSSNRYLYKSNDGSSPSNGGRIQGVYGQGSREDDNSPYGGHSYANGDGGDGYEVKFESGRYNLGYYSGGGGGSGSCTSNTGQGGSGGGGNSGYSSGRSAHKDGYPGSANTGGGGGAGAGACGRASESGGTGGAGGSGVILLYYENGWLNE